MATVRYKSQSPYSKTKVRNGVLDVLTPIQIPKFDSDKDLLIDKIYNNRPDLLAYDLYGSTRLWWVFSVRNPDIIKDPIYDFVEGITIKVTDQKEISRIISS